MTALRSLELDGACYERDGAYILAEDYWPPDVVAPALTRLDIRHMREPHRRYGGPGDAPGMPWLSRLPMLQVRRCDAA